MKLYPSPISPSAPLLPQTDFTSTPPSPYSSRPVQPTTLTPYEQEKLENHLLRQLPAEFANIDTSKFLVHKLDRMHDSLTSLAIFYHVQEEDIKRLNKFTDLDLYGKEYLLIPRMNVTQLMTEHKDEKKLLEERLHKEQRKHEILTKSFAKLYNISHDESHFYLNYNEWDISKAREHYLDDKKWEDSHNKQSTLQRRPAVINSAQSDSSFFQL